MRLLIALMLLGCASAPAKKKPPQDMTYKEAIRRAVAITAAQSQMVVRYNPVRCSCPPFEVQVGSRWVRLALDDVEVAESTAAQLNTRARGDADAKAVNHYRVTGDLDTSLSRCAQGTLYLTLSVDSVD